MTGRKDNKKIVNMVKVKPEVFEWAIKDANRYGRDVREHIGYLLEILYKLPNSIDEIAANNPRVKLLQHELHFQEEMRNTKAVYQMAAAYVERPTERNADRLKEACDIADVDYDAIIQTASNDPFSTYIAEHGIETKLSDAVLWLRNIFSEYSQIPSRDLYNLADKMGYGERLLRRAKNALCEDLDNPLIEVVKPGDRWIWQLRSDEIGKIKPLVIAHKPMAAYFLNPYDTDPLNIIEISSDEIVEESGNIDMFNNFDD